MISSSGCVLRVVLRSDESVGAEGFLAHYTARSTGATPAAEQGGTPAAQQGATPIPEQSAVSSGPGRCSGAMSLTGSLGTLSDGAGAYASNQVCRAMPVRNMCHRHVVTCVLRTIKKLVKTVSKQYPGTSILMAFGHRPFSDARWMSAFQLYIRRVRGRYQQRRPSLSASIAFRPSAAMTMSLSMTARAPQLLRSDRLVGASFQVRSQPHLAACLSSSLQTPRWKPPDLSQHSRQAPPLTQRQCYLLRRVRSGRRRPATRRRIMRYWALLSVAWRWAVLGSVGLW